MARDEDPPRLVIDTNVFVSGLISELGFPFQILRAIRTHKITHLVSDPIVEEYLRVLDYPRIRKFNRITDEYIADVAAYLVYHTERVEVASEFHVSPDPEDDMFLEAAVDGNATMLVTGDKADLLPLRMIEGIPILSAREAVDRLRL